MATEDYAKKKKEAEKSMTANKEKMKTLKSTCDKAKIRLETLGTMFDENIAAINKSQTDVNWVKSNIIPTIDKIIDLQNQLKEAEKNKDEAAIKTLNGKIETLHQSAEPLKNKWLAEIKKERELQEIMGPNHQQLKKLA